MNQPTQKQNNDEWKKFAYDRPTRLAVVSKSHFWFFHIYFARYIKYMIAPFQLEFFAITHDAEIKTAVIESFRNSGKTTIMNFSYPIWAILGEQQKKFILLVARTESQARQYLTNIKTELESNKLLRSDLGPFQEPDDEWRAVSIVLPRYDARITAVSIDQSIRGLKHGPHRPDLIICDDLEDLAAVKTMESRDKLYNWLVGDILPMGDVNTKMVVIGTRLHEDSLIMRLKQKIESGEMTGRTFHYPLVDKNNKIAWPSKFPTMDSIEAERKKIGNDIAWRREYLLEIVPDENQIIYPEHIKYYDKLPDEPPRYTFTAVDPAISQRDGACKTAMVSARVYGSGKNLQIYILSNPVNTKLEFIEMIEKIKELSRILGNGSRLTKVFVEDVGFQKAVIQTLHNEGYPVEGIRPGDQDKRARLYTVSHLIQGGQVLFPRRGAETLIKQVVGFSVERYDDLVDALTLLLSQIMIEESKPKAGITFLNVGGSRRGRSIWDDDDCDLVIGYSGRE